MSEHISKRDFIKLIGLLSHVAILELIREKRPTDLIYKWLQIVIDKSQLQARFPEMKDIDIFSHDKKTLDNDYADIKSWKLSKNRSLKFNLFNRNDKQGFCEYKFDNGIYYAEGFSMHEEGLLPYKLLSIPIATNEDYLVSLNIVSDGQPQSLAFLQNGPVERGDVYFSIAGKNGFIPTGISFNLPKDGISNSIDPLHILSIRTGRCGRYLTNSNLHEDVQFEENGEKYNMYYTGNYGSLFSMYIDLLRHDNQEDIFNCIDQLDAFINTMLTNANVFGYRK